MVRINVAKPGCVRREVGMPVSRMARAMCGSRRLRMPRCCAISSFVLMRDFCGKRPGMYSPRSLLIAALLIVSSPLFAAGAFNRGNIGEPDSLDPHLTTSGYSGNVIFEMFTGLTTVDPQVNVIPGAAESWTISPDGKTYVFKMREGMVWSDGRPVTAADFEYAFRRTMDPTTASRAAPMFYMIENGREVNTGKLPPENLGVRAVDDRTFEVRLLHPTPYFLELVVHRCFPVPRWAIEKHGREWTRPENVVVNGAFKLAEWVPNSRIRLFKNPTFFAAASVALDEVNIY
ncbi:MAG: peptide ABC transporter substrate-binding protein, partial [Alphaproteobacteria bacterium]|nr:peptide ABC transporter substrate-binding protein [Alphaproteobacteria bacterium]